MRLANRYNLIGPTRLVGEGLNPEKINIKAFLVSVDAEWYHEQHIKNPHESYLGENVGRALKFMIFACIFSHFQEKRGQMYVKKNYVETVKCKLS